MALFFLLPLYPTITLINLILSKMRRFLFFFLTMFAVLGSVKADEFTGKVATFTKATTVTTEQWYALYNVSTKQFLKDDGNGLLTSSSTPALNNAWDYTGCFVKLESASEGTYYIKTGNGNYLRQLSDGTTAVSTTEPGAFTVSLMDGTTDVWAVGNGGRYLNGAMSSETTLGSSTSSTAWTIYAVSLVDQSALTASQRLTYQTKQIANTEGTLARLFCKRNTSRYLTSTASGSAYGAALSSKTDYSQIWLITPNESGYTIRNASTGEFLTANYGTPGDATTLYIQRSPNNGTNDFYLNISSSTDFSGNTCLNLNGDGVTLYKWAYGGDAGCDWAAEIVYEVTLDEVKDHLEASNIYASELKDGAYYRIISDSYDVCITESTNQLKCIPANDSNYSQYWQLRKSGNGWRLRNVYSENYIQIQSNQSNIYRTSTSPATFYISDAGDTWKNTWFIANSNGGSACLHCDASRNVVMWYTSADASKWLFMEVELTAEEIADAQASYKEYVDLLSKVSTYQTHLDQLFEDKACTTLKSSIQALTDTQLESNADYQALNADMQAMVKKVKNNTWQQYTNTSTGYTAGYEKFFRIADYQIYSNYQEMCNSSNFTMSNNFGRLSGPTGIVANPGEIFYIYVDQDPQEECTLAVELVGTSGVSGNHSTGEQKTIKQGLNVFMASEQMLIYIFHQLNNTQKYLADYPDIKVHIEGGMLNGYWDATRGMTDADWALLQQDLLKAPFLNLKTKHLVFQMDAPLVKSAEPKEMEGLMRIWEQIAANEDRYMGVEDFEGRYNNIWNAFSGASSYMHSSTFGTWYTESTIPTVMNYANMRKPGNIWGPSHEIGHNHQGSINIVGTTESSNNLFSNINRFEQGIQTSRRQLPPDMFDDLAKGNPWVKRSIWQTTGMFFQLYLYFHAMHNDDEFYPNLFRAMRKDPFNKWSSWDSTTEFVDGGETKTGAYVTLGSKDYLHLAKKICDVAQADLSEFFEAYGMFIPVENFHVGDYANYLVTTTQADIAAAKKYMQKYPKKLGNIMFIDDHVAKYQADPDNKFEGLPASDGYKVNDTAQHDELGNGLGVGTTGDYMQYDGHQNYETNNDRYSLSNGKISFTGKGQMGHKVYDLDGNLIWGCNGNSVTIPSAIASLFPDQVVVVAAEANMKDVPCPYYKSGSSLIYKLQVSFADGTSKQWWANQSIDAYLPENAIAVLETNGAPDELTASVNVVNTDGTAQRIVIDGDLPLYLTKDVTAGSLSFTKSGEGYQALSLPFAVAGATTIEGNVMKKAEGNVEAGQPVVVNGAASYNLSNASLVAGNYTETESGNVLATDGKSVVSGSNLSPFTYRFNSTFDITVASAINDILSAPDADNQKIYDLNGRRIGKVTKGGIYIVNGKQTLVR